MGKAGKDTPPGPGELGVSLLGIFRGCIADVSDPIYPGCVDDRCLCLRGGLVSAGDTERDFVFLPMEPEVCGRDLMRSWSVEVTVAEAP